MIDPLVVTDSFLRGSPNVSKGGKKTPLFHLLFHCDSACLSGNTLQILTLAPWPTGPFSCALLIRHQPRSHVRSTGFVWFPETCAFLLPEYGQVFSCDAMGSLRKCVLAFLLCGSLNTIARKTLGSQPESAAWDLLKGLQLHESKKNLKLVSPPGNMLDFRAGSIPSRRFSCLSPGFGPSVPA